MMRKSKLDEMDLQLYAAMPHVPDREGEAYAAADEKQLGEARQRAILRKLRHRDGRAASGSVRAVLRRAVVAALIVCTVGFLGVMSVEAVRDALRETVIGWYEDFITLRMQSGEQTVLTGGLSDYRPAQVDGYLRHVIVRDDAGLHVEYTRGDSVVTYRQTPLDGSTLWLSGSDGELETICLDADADRTVYLTQGDDTTTLVWCDAAYRYLLTGDLPLWRLADIAASVK